MALRSLALGSLLVVSASCGAGPHVSADIRGDIIVRIANGTQDSICELYIQPASDAKAKHDNLLGKGLKQKKVGKGAEHEVRLKAADYNVGVKGCNGQWAAATMKGPLTISAPIVIVIGDHPETVSKPADFDIAQLVPERIDGRLPGGFGEGGGGGGGGDSGGQAACSTGGQDCNPNQPCCEGFSCHWIKNAEGIFGDRCEAVP